MTAKVGFFNPVDILGIDSDWEVQTETPQISKQRAQGLKSNGDESASKLYDEKTSVTLAFKNFIADGVLVLPDVGTVNAAGYHIDSISLDLAPTDWPSLSVTAHKHAPTSHTEGSCRIYKSSLVFAAGWGIPRNPGGFALAEGDTAIGIASVKYSLGCTHLDEAQNGSWLAGENRDGVEKFDISLTGTGATITPITGWDKLESGAERSNQAADGESASYEHHVEFFVAEG